MRENRSYFVEIEQVSKDVTKKESVLLKDTSDAVALAESCEDGAVIIKPAMWAVLNIHNENNMNGDKDYKCYLIVDEDGNKYKTGSESFWNSFCDIVDDMADSDEEWAVKAYRLPSKNGKQDFITCSII